MIWFNYYYDLLGRFPAGWKGNSVWYAFKWWPSSFGANRFQDLWQTLSNWTIERHHCLSGLWRVRERRIAEYWAVFLPVYRGRVCQKNADGCLYQALSCPNHLVANFDSMKKDQSIAPHVRWSLWSFVLSLFGCTRLRLLIFLQKAVYEFRNLFKVLTADRLIQVCQLILRLF